MLKSVFANNRLRVSITDSCNMHCPYCSNEGQEHNNGTMIDIDVLERIAKKIIDEHIYVRKLNITGGEPLLHDNLIDIIDICNAFCDSLTINTNGKLIDIKKIDDLHKAGINNIKFGIDSFFQKTTKPGAKQCSHNNIIESLLYSIKIMPRSSVNIVLTDFNRDEFDDIFDFIVTNRINKVEILELIEHDFRKSDHMISPGPKFIKIIKKYEQIIDKITYNPRLAKYICYLTNGLIVQFADDFCTRRVCQNLWTRIDASGYLLPCIKAGDSIKINFDLPLAAQISECNNMMCSSTKKYFPRDYQGNILAQDQTGEYQKPILGKNIILDDSIDP